MDHAIVNVPVAAVRRKAKHQSEMVNQLLFGELVKVTREKGPLWIKVRGLSDGYEGWLTRTLVREVSPADAALNSNFVTIATVSELDVDGLRMLIPTGSSLPQFDNGKGKFGGLSYSFAGEVRQRNIELPGPGLIRRLTSEWINAPYLWGGKTIYGIDCSGFVQVNFKLMGIDLPRDAWQQAQEGKSVDKLKDSVCGDLAFFDDKDEIVHVGILLGEGKIIHASGKVRIDGIDKKGIVHSDTGKRTHSLRAIRRIC